MKIHIELIGEGTPGAVAAALAEIAGDIVTLPIPAIGANFGKGKIKCKVHKIIGTTSSRKASQKSKN